MPDLTCVAPTVCAALGVRPPQQATGAPIADVVHDLSGSRRIAVVILDGLGMATWRAAEGRTPALSRLAQGHLIELRSVLPAVTPVCFAAIAAGCGIETHKVRQREDPFRAETIFEVMRETGHTSGVAGAATCSATRVLGRWSDITRRVPDGEDRDARILAACLRVIQQDQPDLFFTQFVAVDEASHKHSPFSPQTAAAVAQLDGHFGQLLRALKPRGYCVLALADHGQHPVEDSGGPKRGTHDGSVEEDMIVPLVWERA